VELFPVTGDAAGTLKTPDTDKYDGIGIAHPIYGANIPPLVRSFIAALENVLEHDKKLFIVSTFGYINGFGYFAERKLFRKLKIRQYINVRMPNNVTTPRVKSVIPGNAARDSMKKEALKLLERAAARIAAGRKMVMGIAPYLVPGIFIRKISRGAIADHYRQLSVDTVKCSRCLDCANHCPARAIELRENKIVFTSRCTACMRCYNYCPRNAVLIDGLYADPAEYPRYRFQ
jgi:Pyruvate/2-oxoacid:ferredoxin oxidoreductase delta subunit